MNNIKYSLLAITLASSLILVFSMGGTLTANAQTTGSMSNLQRGLFGDSVRELQNILKSDPSIYPQGLSTGFFGPATESAIKRLQARYGLPQTGVVDSATLQVIFPNNVQLKVISPNGGELWHKSANNTITWQVTIGPLMVNGQQLSPGASSSPNMITRPQIAPFFNSVSIDLIRDSAPNFRYHIGTADLYQTQFSWQVPANISNASDYRVQITGGGVVPCLEGRGTSVICPMYFPQYSFSDQSDNVFSITGSEIPDDTKERLKVLLDQIQQTINTLFVQLQALKSLVNTL